MFAAMDDRVRSFMKGLYTSEAFGYEDPTYLGFSLHFDFDPVHRDVESGQTEDPLFAEPGAGLESAREYLENIGFTQKAEQLYQFREMLRFMNEKAPYYFQGIQGVAELWKINKESAQSGGQNVFDTFRSRNKFLVIDCLESIDLRMTALADLYRKSTFDAKYMRYIVPDNLRWFTVRLRIAEIRKFHRVRGILNGTNGGAPASTINSRDQLNNPNQTSVVPVPPNSQNGPTAELEELDKLISVVEFELSHCEFDFEESFADEFRMSGDTEMAKQKLKIKVGKIAENNHYTLLNMLLRDYYSVDSGGVIVEKSRVTGGGLNGTEANDPDRRQDFDRSINPSTLFSGLTSTFSGPINAATGTAAQLGNAVANFVPNQIGNAIGALNSAATAQILGNVYDNLNTFLSSNDILNPIQGGQGQSIEPLGDVYPNVPGDDLNTKSSGNLGNVYQ